MAISLKKNQSLSLKKVRNLSTIMVGIGWDLSNIGKPADVDVQCFLLGDDGKVRSDEDFIFYGQKSTPDRTVVHSGDNRTGAGDGDDETIKIDLTKMDPSVSKLVFTVTIHEALKRNQQFGKILNAYVRLHDTTANEVILKFDLMDDTKNAVSVYFAEIYRSEHNGEQIWEFKAVGEGTQLDLEGICKAYGVNVG